MESDILFLMRELIEQILCKMEWCCRSCYRSVFLCKRCLIIFLLRCPILYIGRKRKFPVALHERLYTFSMSTHISSTFWYADDFEVSLSEEDFCSYFELIPWSNEGFKTSIDLFFAKKNLPILYILFSSISSLDSYIFESDACPENTRIIEKNHSITRNILIEIPKSRLASQDTTFSFYNHKSSIMVRMYSFLRDKLRWKDIRIVRSCVHEIYINNKWMESRRILFKGKYTINNSLANIFFSLLFYLSKDFSIV